MLTALKTKVIAGSAAALLAASVLTTPVMAQDTFSESHLAAARAAVTATRTTIAFDNILPDVAERTRALFQRSEPSLLAEIDTAVNEVALKMAASRPQLDRVIYEVWARRFSEAELQQIADFYNSETGKKLATVNPQLSALAIGAAKQWSDQLSVEMVKQVRARLQNPAN
ncbi:DUF2059 domain-containing protein [Polycladidibacter hongkongensis]|uniref:DUF2059 domain-containing protein n=1 Tax=Polycladidibacter hongkongensis TaxID=1647556 RepID=UPI00082C876C|nr:DUF2059 domain-containing protein [Pseudovibrio hongkongensis]